MRPRVSASRILRTFVTQPETARFREPIRLWFPLIRVKARCGLKQPRTKHRPRIRRMTMKMKTMRTKVQLFVAVILTAGLFAACANAQSGSGVVIYRGNFTLPHETHWGRAMLPAGEYSISFDSNRTPALVRSKDGKTSVFTPMPITNDGNKGPATLLIAARGDNREVLALN